MKDFKFDLPLLKAFTSTYPAPDFGRTLLIAGQHLLGTTISLFEALKLQGLDEKNIFVLGKCYSTNCDVLEYLAQETAVGVSRYSATFDSEISFDQQYRSYVEAFVADNREAIATFKKIIVVDDGGYLLAYMNKVVDMTSTVIVGVEQTSAGYAKLKGIQLKFPVINVARAPAKLELESPMIARLIARKVSEYLSDEGLQNARILIIGQGSIGRHIYENLFPTFATSVHDVRNDPANIPARDIPDLCQYDVIIGATGRTVLRLEDFARLKRDVALVSASSSDREFSASYLRGLLPRFGDCHTDVRVEGLTLLNGGFPVNFDGGLHSLPPDEAQLTRTLLLQGIYQAGHGAIENGIIDLDLEAQNFIAEQFTRLQSGLRGTPVSRL